MGFLNRIMWKFSKQFTEVFFSKENRTYLINELTDKERSLLMLYVSRRRRASDIICHYHLDREVFLSLSFSLILYT